MNAKPLCLSALVAMAALALPAAPAFARDDFKFVAGADCVPYQPNTQATELQITPAGLYNPGPNTERVICPMPRDQEDPYLTSEVTVTVYYRGLAATRRVACTLFVGSPHMQIGPVVTSSAIGDAKGGGARGSLVLHGNNQDQEFDTVPVSVMCSLDAGMALAGVFFAESGPTNIP